MVSDQAHDDLEALIEDTPRDIDWAIERYKKEKEKIENRTMESLSEEQKREYAVGMVDSDELYDNRMSGSGEEVELEILSIGQAGRIDEWGDDNDSVVYSYGFIFGPLGDDGKEKAARAVFVNKKSDGMDLSEVQRKFHAENTMKAVYEVSESDDLSGMYRCFSCDATELVEEELDNLPDDRDEKLTILREATPDAELASITENLSAYDPDSGYNHDFGADLRRIDGRIVDWYIPDDNSWGRYTIMDESVTADDIVGTEITDEDANIPGLTVWADPDYHMEYGRKTRAEFYGTIEEGSNGNVQMNLVGIIPIVPMPMEDRDDSGDDTDANRTETSL